MAFRLVVFLPLLFGCAQVSSSSHDITTHCMQHEVNGGAGKTSIEDCTISVDTKSRSTGF